MDNVRAQALAEGERLHCICTYHGPHQPKPDLSDQFSTEPPSLPAGGFLLYDKRL